MTYKLFVTDLDGTLLNETYVKFTRATRLYTSQTAGKIRDVCHRTQFRVIAADYADASAECTRNFV